MMTKGRELIIPGSKEWLNSPITVSEGCQKGGKKLISSAQLLDYPHTVKSYFSCKNWLHFGKALLHGKRIRRAP